MLTVCADIKSIDSGNVDWCAPTINMRSQVQLHKTHSCGAKRQPVLPRPHTQQTAGLPLAATLPASFVVG